MITASLSHFNRYVSLHPNFSKVEEFLKTFEFRTPGEKIYIDSDKLFVIQAIENGKCKEDALLEAHNKYIDIQVCLEGDETIGWRNRNECSDPESPFDESKDIIFYNDEPLNYVKIPAGSFAIFYPEDCHAPLIGKGSIKKIIFKVEVKVH